LSIAAAAMLAAQPSHAAEDFGDGRTTQVRAGGFAGLSLRVPLDGARSRRPTARLQVTGIRQMRDASGATRTTWAEGVQLGAGRGGRPTLTIAGQDPFRTRDRLGVHGSTGTALLIGGGIVLIVFVLASVADAMPKPGPQEGAFD
jgi:hypothetical protein